MKLSVPRIALANISVVRAIIVAIFTLAAVTNSARGQLYGVENDTGNLYRISTANAALSLVGNTGASLLGSLEYRPSNGFLYGIGSLQSPLGSGNGNGLLYRINPANASTTLVGSIGPEHVFEGGLVIAPDGTAYATNMNFNDNPALFKINLDTAATTMVGIISGGGHDINGLAWRSDNMLVGLDRVTDSLLAINPSTAVSSVIATVSAPIGGTGGMATLGDSGYFATGSFNGSNSLYSFNLNSGAHTLIGNFAPTVAGVGISGLAIVVPEPASVTLAALAIVPLFVRRRRSQAKTPNFFRCRDRNATSAVSAVALCRCNRSRAFSKLTFVASLVLFCAISLVALQSASAVTIDLVPVGNPGNAPDTRYNGISVGSVANAYQISKYEVTAGQYSEFLNAVAKADPNGLYNPAMGAPFNNYGINIQRAGSSPNYSYSVAADWANRPVAFVSFWDATRYANWLHNDQPTGAQGPGTTEGGAYHDVGNQVLFGRNPGAEFFIPTENEWYKAAYHDKTAGLAASYFDYPTGSNTAPINTLPDPGNHANFNDSFGTGNNSYTIGPPYYRTNVGEFANSASPYGTFDQGGNVREWNETAVATSTRGFRGGTWDLNGSLLLASVREDFTPTLEQEDLGFRIASTAIPEPSTGVLGAIACGLMWWRRSARVTLRLSSKNSSPVFSLFRCLDVGRPIRFFAVASLAIVTCSCAISAASAGTFQITGRVRQVNSFTVDISGLMQVNNPFQLTYSFDPTLSDSNANSTFGVYEQSVGGPYFLNGSAGNFAFSATDTFKMVVQNQDAIFPDNYSVQIAVSNVGFGGNFPAGTAPNNTEMYMPIAFDIPNAQGDANLLTPPNLASIPANNKNFQFYFKDASNTTVAQFFAFVDEAHIVPEPATFISAGLALIALFAFASHRRGRVPTSK